MDNNSSSSSEDYTIMVAISIGVLTFIFMCAFFGLLYVCWRHSNRLQQTKRWSRFDDTRAPRPSKRKAKPKRACPEPELALALNDIGLGSALDRILNDEQWLDDASGVIPHCLAILRICHSLTERLAELAMRPASAAASTASAAAAAAATTTASSSSSPTSAAASTGRHDATARLIEATKRVPFRVDDVVRSMYPPFDLRLLEARLAALVLAVGQVALLTQSITVPVGGGGGAGAGAEAVARWIDEGLNEMDSRLMVLRKVAQQQSADEQSGAGRVYLHSSQV